MERILKQSSFWVVVAVGTVLILLLESTFHTSGILFADDQVWTHASVAKWLMATQMIVYYITALMCQSMVEIWSHRKVAMVGCFIASFGFLMAASTLSLHGWLIVAYSGIVGFGIGLAVHTTYLLVIEACVREYTGLSVGILEMGAGVGYLTAPYFYNNAIYEVNSAEDKLLIRALCSVLAFVAAILYVMPLYTISDRLSVMRPKDSSEQNEANEVGNKDSYNPEGIPLMEIKSRSENFENTDKPRKRSHYLLEISATMLPNIPEESEGPSTNVTGNCTPAMSSSFNNLSRDKSQSDSEVLVGQAWNATGQYEQPSEQLFGTSSSANITCDRFVDLETHIKFHGPVGNSVGNNNQIDVSGGSSKDTNVNANIGDACDQPSSAVEDSVHGNETRILPLRLRMIKSLRHLKFRYLKQTTFLVTAIGIALSEVALEFIPLVVYGQIVRIKNVNYSSQGEIALLLIYCSDILARLVIAYISDSKWFTRRLGFFIGNICASISTTGFGLSSTIGTSFCLAVMHGITRGTMFATKTVLLVDVFGVKDFPSTYGFTNIFKAIFYSGFALFVISPNVSQLDVIHPLTPFDNLHRNNNSLFSGDERIEFIELTADESQLFSTVFTVLAIPGFLSFILWLPGELRLFWRKICLPDLNHIRPR